MVQRFSSTPLTLPPLTIICLGAPAHVDVDAFFDSLLDFLVLGGHFIVAAFKAGHRDAAGAEALGAGGDVDGDAAAANDDDLLADGRFLAQVDIFQEGSAWRTPLASSPGTLSLALFCEPTATKTAL